MSQVRHRSGGCSTDSGHLINTTVVYAASGAATVAAGLVVGEWRKRVREHGFRGWVRAPRCRPDAVRWSAGRPNAGVDGCDQAIQLAEKAFNTAYTPRRSRT